MGAATQTIGVVVLNWRRPAESVRCLESVLASEYDALRVYFVDNGSGDGSESLVRQRFPGVSVLQTGANRGYAGGNNAGIRRALEDGCEFVFILNNDATVEPGCIAELAAAAEANPEAGLFQPLILRWMDGSAYPVPVRWAARFDGFHVIDPQDDEANATLSVAYAAGSALFVRAEVFRLAGLFDESFFLCWEEVDLAYRARRAGYGSLLVRSARARHEGHASFGGRVSPAMDYFNCRNQWRWASRHLSRGHRLRLLRSEMRGFARCWRDLALGTGGRRRSAFARLAAYRDLLLRRSGNAPAWVWRL
jgi:GT2 family glycosyltransferase